MCIWKYLLPILLALYIIYKEGPKPQEQYVKVPRYEGYQNNQPPPDRPDELQFMACHDNRVIPFDNQDVTLLGNNNYKLHKHNIGMPASGVYSSFIDTYGIRNYDEFFHAPICEQPYDFSPIQSLQHRPIPDSTDEDIETIYAEERAIDEYSIRDPHHVYVDPEYIGNQVLYPKHINKIFLQNHHSHNTEIMQHRMDRGLYGNDIKKI